MSNVNNFGRNPQPAILTPSQQAAMLSVQAVAPVASAEKFAAAMAAFLFPPGGTAAQVQTAFSAFKTNAAGVLARTVGFASLHQIADNVTSPFGSITLAWENGLLMGSCTIYGMTFTVNTDQTVTVSGTASIPV